MNSISLIKIYFIISTFSFIFFSSCVNKKTEQNQLQENVMAIHDSLMMDMGKLTENRMQLSKLSLKFDSLKRTDSTLDTMKLKNTISDNKLELSKADDSMMEWMNNFDPDYTGKSQEEIVSYLQDQKIKIDSVKTLIKHSLSKSGTLLNKYN